jgi:hypothetical protein
VAESYDLRNANPAERARIRAMIENDERPKTGASSDGGESEPASSSSPSSSSPSKIIPAAVHKAPRRVLVGELMAASVLVTIEQVGAGEIPSFQRYISIFIVYLLLAFGSMAGDQAARIAAGFGGLVLLAVGMRASGAITKILPNVAGSPTTPPAGPRGPVVMSMPAGGRSNTGGAKSNVIGTQAQLSGR